MKRPFLFLFFSPLSLFASASSWPVTTWGNSKVMKQIFDAVAALFSSRVYQNYLQFGVFCGLIALLLMVAWKADLFATSKQWLIPTFCFLSFGLMPVRVVVYDQLALTDISIQKVGPVDHVPLFVAAPVSLLTGVAGEITELVETIYHKVNDAIYNWTGHIYAGHSIYNTRKMRILDGTTEQNFREFCRECVFRDLGLGLYTREELLKAPRLIQFLKERTSTIRGCNYIYPTQFSFNLAKATNQDTLPKDQLVKINNKGILPGTKGRVSCRKAIHLIAMNLAGQLLNQKEMLLGAIGNQFGFLSNQARNAPIGRVIEQQIAIDTIRDYTNPTHMSLAASKARLVQNETNRFLGLFSAVDLMELRNTFTLILIALAPFLGVISLMQLGFGMMLSYIKLLGWLSSWPPFYVVINFLLDHKWMEKKALYGISSQEFTLASSEALFEIWKQQQSLANSLLCWVPPLSWAVLFLAKQGVHALVSMMGGLGAAAQGAASAAATESVTGIQNYRNVNTDNQSTGQASFFQQQRSPFLGQGAVTSQDAVGKTTSNLIGNKITYAQHLSQLAASPQMKKALSKSLSKNISDAESFHRGNTTAFNGTVSDLVSMMQDKGFGKQTTLGQTEGHTHNVQKGWMSQAQKVKNQLEAYAKNRGISTQDIFRASVNAGLGFSFGTSLGLSTELGFNYNDLTDDQKQQRIAEDFGLFKQIQQLSQTAKVDGVNLSGNSDVSSIVKFSNKFDRLMNISEGYKASHSRLKALKEMENIHQSNDLAATKNLINPFVRYVLAQNGGDIGKFQQATCDQAKMDQYMTKFLSEYEPQLTIDRSPLVERSFQETDLQKEYEKEQKETIDRFIAKSE